MINTIEEKEITEIIATDNETGELYVPKSVTKQLAMIKQAKKEFDAYEKNVKEKLKEAMEEYSVTKIESDDINVTYVGESERITVDTKMLKELYPDVYEAVTKVSPVKASIRMNLK